MLVQTSVPYTSIQDAKDALELLKTVPGFILGYLVSCASERRLVFLYLSPDGNVNRPPELIEALTNKPGAEVLPFAYLTTTIIQYPRSAYEREQAAQNAEHLQTLKHVLSDRREDDRTGLAVIIFELVKYLESINSLDALTPDAIEGTISTWIVTGLTPTENAALPTW